jgi:hypothetical protein
MSNFFVPVPVRYTALPLCAEPDYAKESLRVCPPALTKRAHKVTTVNNLADGMFIPILDPDFLHNGSKIDTYDRKNKLVVLHFLKYINSTKLIFFLLQHPWNTGESTRGNECLPMQADSARPDSRRPGKRDSSVKISPEHITH